MAVKGTKGAKVRQAEGVVRVRVEGAMVWVGFDTSKPVGRLSLSGKSMVVARTLGLARSRALGKRYGVMAGLYEIGIGQ